MSTTPFDFSALDKKSGILELPPLADSETGKVVESIFVHGDDGTARWITLDGRDYNDSSSAAKGGDVDEDDEAIVEMEEQNKLDDLRRFLLAKSESNAKAVEQQQAESKTTAEEHQLRQTLNISSSSTKNNNNVQQQQGDQSSSSSSGQLWVTRYGAQRFSELLSDERVNLEVLQWLTSWKKKIQNASASPSSLSRKQQQQQALLDQELDKIILLTGPPGVGKTTLAHVVCKHCGFDAIEVNASYSRSAQEMKNLIESATSDTGSAANMSATGGGGGGETTGREDQTKKLLRPKCLILDEIDGSTSNIIKILLSVNIRRPVMCLANNLYAPVLRELRSRLSFIRQVPPLLPPRIVSRLEAIAEREKIHVDRHSLMDLALHCAGDIRQCLNTLFFVSRQVSQNSNSNTSTNAASRLLRLLRVREPTVSIWTLWETTLERKEKSKYITNLSSAGVMAREEAAALAAGSGGEGNNGGNNNRIDIASLWVGHCASKCPELDTVINGLHEWFCQLGYADYNCKATASVCESFAWLDKADPFTGLQYNGISQQVVVNTFRSCATLSARPSHLRNAVPREAATWAAETLRTKELIAEFLEKPSPHILGSIIKVWCTSSTAAKDILPQLAKLLSQVPFGVKLPPGIRSLKDVRNVRDADVIKRIMELLQCFGVTFSHDTSSEQQKQQLKDFRNKKYGNDNNNNNNNSNNNNFVQQQEWKMTPDLEDWAKYKTVQKMNSGYNNNNNNNNNNNFYPNSKFGGNTNTLRDPAQGAVRAAAGVKARPPTVWETNTKTLPADIRELLVGELAMQKLMQTNTGGDAKRRQREEEESARLKKSSAASLFEKTGDDGVNKKKKEESGPTKPANSADASSSTEQKSTTTSAGSNKPPLPPGNFKKDFFGRPIIPKHLLQQQQQQQQQAEDKNNNNTTTKDQTPSSKLISSSSPSKVNSNSRLISSASKLKRQQQEQSSSQQQQQQYPCVKYRYFDGSSNSVRKGAVYSDFF